MCFTNLQTEVRESISLFPQTLVAGSVDTLFKNLYRKRREKRIDNFEFVPLSRLRNSAN